MHASSSSTGDTCRLPIRRRAASAERETRELSMLAIFLYTLSRTDPFGCVSPDHFIITAPLHVETTFSRSPIDAYLRRLPRPSTLVRTGAPWRRVASPPEACAKAAAQAAWASNRAPRRR